MRRCVRYFINHVKRFYILGGDIEHQTSFLYWLNGEMETRLAAASELDGTPPTSLLKRQRMK